jgi:two-component system nitrate/nitrite response regulator NarL
MPAGPPAKPYHLTARLLAPPGIMSTSIDITDASLRHDRAWQIPPRARIEHTANDSISVLLVCAVRLYREGLSRTLTQQTGPRIHVAATASNAEDALRLAHMHRPHLALIDSSLPGSVNVAREIVREVPQTRVLVLAINESDDDVIAIAEAGVSGYVPRDGSQEDLLAAIERAARGEVLCPPNIVASLFRHMAELAGERTTVPALAGLTVREQEIVLLLGEGVSNKEIARRLAIRVATVKNHVHNILTKLGVNRRFAVAALLMRHREHG